MLSPDVTFNTVLSRIQLNAFLYAFLDEPVSELTEPDVLVDLSVQNITPWDWFDEADYQGPTIEELNSIRRRLFQ